MRKKLLKFRIEHDLKQEDMALILGMTQSTYARKENKERQFTESEIKQIKEYFNLSKEELVELIFED